MTTLVESVGTRREDRNAATNRLLREARDAPAAERRQLIDQVIVLNLEVAHSIARRYRGRGIAVEDLEQAACVALVRTANQFDPDQADDFLTYAVPSMSGEVKRYFRDHGWTIRPPRRLQEVQALINRDSRASDGHPESADEVARRLGLPVKDVSDALLAQGCFAPQSLDAPTSDGADTLGDSLLASDGIDELDAAEARVILGTLTRDLTPRERLILYLRFVEGRTQSEIGAEIGVTQMQVSRLLNRTLSRLRESAAGQAAVA